jgi:hypothetical protein
MSGNISFNPNVTTVAAGTFNISSEGYIQGTALNDPSVRNELAGGTVALTESSPMWGGIAITENVPPTGIAGTLGGNIKRATAETNITGFTVFDQAHGMINFPQSPVPLAAPGMQVNLYRIGSNARIAVAASPTLVGLDGMPITSQVAWDYENQQLVPYVSTTISSGTYATAATISSGTYTLASGAVSLTTNAAHGLLVGDTFTLSSMAGTGAFAALNGTFTATAGTTGSTLNFVTTPNLVMTISGGDLGNVGVTLTTAAAHGLNVGDTFVLAGLTGTDASTLDGEQVATVGTTGSTLNFVAASGLGAGSITGGTVNNGAALNVRLLDVNVGNSQTVVYSGGFANWNRQGTSAIILI